MTLDLNCANFIDDKGNTLKFPPDGLKKHPQKLDKASIRAAIEKGAEKLVITAPNTEAKDLANKAAKKAEAKTTTDNNIEH